MDGLDPNEVWTEADFIQEDKSMASPAYGEVWYGDLDPTVGHEQAGRHPVLVVSPDKI